MPSTLTEPLEENERFIKRCGSSPCFRWSFIHQYVAMAGIFQRAQKSSSRWSWLTMGKTCLHRESSHPCAELRNPIARTRSLSH